jgi:uncharacterized protein YmfQ (DUF2313 family)
MMRTLSDYKNQLIALLPDGVVWPVVGVVSNLTTLLEVAANELQRVDAAFDDLIDNLMPDSTSQLISEWEAVVGLPDPCTGMLPTLQDRVNAVIARLSIQGGLHEQFYIDLAARFTYTITITILGANQMQINASVVTATYFRAGVSRAGDPVATSGNALLQCLINKTKPAHVAVTYNFF